MSEEGYKYHKLLKSSPGPSGFGGMEDVIPEMPQNLNKYKRYTQIPTNNVLNKQNDQLNSDKLSKNHHSKESPIRDSRNSFVKFTSGSNFDDLKSKAINSWDVGIDLQLKADVKKPKQQWISPDEFFNNVGVKETKKKNSTPSAVISETTSTSWQPSTNSSWDTVTNPKKTTYAEAADPLTPSWAVLDTPKSTQQPTFTAPFSSQQLAYVTPTGWPPVVSASVIPPNTPQTVIPLAVVSPKYMPTSLPYSPKDAENMLFLHKVLSDQSAGLLSEFQKKYEEMLDKLNTMPLRSVGLFLDTLAILLNHDQKKDNLDTFQKINNHMRSIINAVHSYIQYYLILPEDALRILRFVAALSKYQASISQDIPVQELFQRCRSFGGFCSANEKVEITMHYHTLEPTQKSGEHWSSFWSDSEEGLPPLPAAEDIIFEAFSGDVLSKYKSKDNRIISNIIQGSWPELNLQNYFFTHYMLHRQELVGPVQDVIHQILTSGTTKDIQDRGDAIVFHSAKPISTMPHIASFETAIVFSLRAISESDIIMNDHLEGSFTVIIPHHDYTKMTNEERVEYIAKTAIMGHVLHSYSTTYNGEIVRLVPIHLNHKEMSRLSWSREYIMITSKNNAPSALSALRWLRESYKNFNKDQFSTSITPRVLAAKNNISISELTNWNEFSEEDENPVPVYMQGAEVEISCIMSNKHVAFKARPDKDVWINIPEQQQWTTMSPTRRSSPYEVSPSQLKAIKYALTHRVAAIAGAPGTGKTYLAGKLALLMSQALSVGQFRQPLLIIAKSQSTLDRILSLVANKIRDTVRFGYDLKADSLNRGKQATKMTIPGVADNDYRQYQRLERRIAYLQTKLDLLCKKRYEIAAHFSDIMATTIPPSYLTQLQKGFCNKYGRFPNNNVELWQSWFINDEQVASAKYQEALFDSINNLQLNQTISAGNGVLPMIESTFFRNRHRWISSNPPKLSAIIDATNWPFETSSRSGSDLRQSLLSHWRQFKEKDIWDISSKEKSSIVDSLANILIEFIDADIQDLLKEQVKDAQVLDDLIVQKWTYVARFNRVIGITADFAAAHQSWLNHLWPRCVIVDEASEILESTLAPCIFGPRVEHLVLFGNTEASSRPTVSNHLLKGNPRNVDVSLFERWKKNSSSEVVRLEEQWRMHSDVANVLNKFNSNKDQESSLLITAPLATCNENMRDNRQNVLYGLTQRMFYIDYQSTRSPQTLRTDYTHLYPASITQADIDEAQFIAHLATYISQQPYPTNAKLAVLTVCDAQKDLIRNCLKNEVPKRTVFKSSLEKIKVSRIDQHPGREYWFTIVSTATPGGSKCLEDNLSIALTRAKYGVYIVGKPNQDAVHPRWNKFSQYMHEIGLYGHQITLTCHKHKTSLAVGFWLEFERIKNGGCNQPCKALMADGHVCPEECHHGSHQEVVCHESCNRIRPSHCTHPCLNKCYECSANGHCPPCTEECTIELDCGHKYTGQCCDIPNIYSTKCTEPVEAMLSCGHNAYVKCFETQNLNAIVCQERDTIVLRCGHSAEASTFVKNCVEWIILTNDNIAQLVVQKNLFVVIAVLMLNLNYFT
ncbi:hypothetical protein G6F64_010658 [Rhizopus arrhizus]|uniref:DNA2/NAM7 helicase-like C-terminal domain-containing protein n=1 Tax=Rhizopus oryzae TaxID=64495 RepID=A0A9P6X0Q7_RHIOR|nr:hypothetical protein G6F64_010658 [Rhizopus arrhizus]